MDDVLSLNNSKIGDFVDRIYHIELEIKDATDTNRSASYLELFLEMDSEGRLSYSRACGSNQNFLDRGYLIKRKLLNQGFLLVKVKSSLRKFYGRHQDYGISVSQLTTDMFHLS